MTGLLVQAPAEIVAPPQRGRGRILTALRRSPKATVGLVIFLIFALVSAFPHVFTSVRNPDDAAAFPSSLQPSGAHWLGTTQLGQDIYAQLIYGTRQSVVIAVVAGLFATVLSVLVGVTAAYIGGVTDEVLSMITNIFLILPTFPLVIIFATYAGKGTLLVILVVLVVTGWSYGANQLRAQTLSLRNRDFLESARVRGERRSYVIIFEVLPTMTSLIVANFLGAALYSVLTAAGLQFLGLGDPNSMSWGTMLYRAQGDEALQSGLPLWSIAPGVCIALLGVSFALLNYAFDEVSNPALRPVRRRRARRIK
jgi:peptide/nickel transport system permease protein